MTQKQVVPQQADEVDAAGLGVVGPRDHGHLLGGAQSRWGRAGAARPARGSRSQGTRTETANSRPVPTDGESRRHHRYKKDERAWTLTLGEVKARGHDAQAKGPRVQAAAPGGRAPCLKGTRPRDCGGPSTAAPGPGHQRRAARLSGHGAVRADRAAWAVTAATCPTPRVGTGRGRDKSPLSSVGESHGRRPSRDAAGLGVQRSVRPDAEAPGGSAPGEPAGVTGGDRG